MTEEEIEKAAEEFATLYYIDTKGAKKFHGLNIGKKEGYFAGFRACQEQMKWISVKERLPEKQGEYLAFSPVYHLKLGRVIDTRTCAVFCYAICKPKAIFPIETGFYYDSIYYPEVTHWIPLPPAPEVEGE